jgi:hypothetical protein
VGSSDQVETPGATEPFTPKDDDLGVSQYRQIFERIGWQDQEVG